MFERLIKALVFIVVIGSFLFLLMHNHTLDSDNHLLDLKFASLEQEKQEVTLALQNQKDLNTQLQVSLNNEEQNNADLADQILDLKQTIRTLKKGISNLRASEVLRQDDLNNSFYLLEETYTINSNIEVDYGWYVLSDDYFSISLNDYEEALKVSFYTERQESDQGPILNYTDTDGSDGWTYTNEQIDEIINPHTGLSGGLQYVPFFMLYTEVSLKDGTLVRTPKLPIYYREVE